MTKKIEMNIPDKWPVPLWTLGNTVYLEEDRDKCKCVPGQIIGMAWDSATWAYFVAWKDMTKEYHVEAKLSGTPWEWVEPEPPAKRNPVPESEQDPFLDWEDPFLNWNEES